MSDIFDRISDFMRSMFGDDDVFADSARNDPDLQDAWEELETFMKTGSTAASGSTGYSGSRTRSSHSTHGADKELHSHMVELRKDYQTLEVPFLADFDLVRNSYKRMLRSYHPDRWGHDTDRMQIATEVTSRITSA
ncbi:MAG: hypothetical protein ACOCVC_02265 [Spirochaeta sp.]